MTISIPGARIHSLAPMKKKALPRRIQKLTDAYRDISMRLVNEHHTLTPKQWLELDTEREIIQAQLHEKYVWLRWQQ
jgi:hypothetical protein